MDKRKWKIERLVNGAWCYWGTYDNPVLLAAAAWDFGRTGTEIRVMEEK